MLFILCIIGGCTSAPKRENQASPPPQFESIELSMIENSTLGGAGSAQQTSDSLSLTTSKVLKKCRMKDRFDRKSLWAYEWVDGARLGLDVDGLNLSNTKINKVRFEYKISLQPELKKKDHCKYASPYQGILGSGYNELVLREDDTIWEEIDGIQAEISHHIATFIEE